MVFVLAASPYVLRTHGWNFSNIDCRGDVMSVSWVSVVITTEHWSVVYCLHYVATDHGDWLLATDWWPEQVPAPLSGSGDRADTRDSVGCIGPGLSHPVPGHLRCHTLAHHSVDPWPAQPTMNNASSVVSAHTSVSLWVHIEKSQTNGNTRPYWIQENLNS